MDKYIVQYIYTQLAIYIDQLDPSLILNPLMSPFLVLIVTTDDTNITVDTLAVVVTTLPPAAIELEDVSGKQQNTTAPLTGTTR